MTLIKPDAVSRRQIFPLIGGAVVFAAAVPRSAAGDQPGSFGKPPGAKARFVYVGTYTFPGTAPGGTHQSQAQGIYVFRMNPNDGGLTPIQTAPIDNPASRDCGSAAGGSILKCGYSERPD